MQEGRGTSQAAYNEMQILLSWHFPALSLLLLQSLSSFSLLFHRGLSLLLSTPSFLLVFESFSPLGPISHLCLFLCHHFMLSLGNISFCLCSLVASICPFSHSPKHPSVSLQFSSVVYIIFMNLLGDESFLIDTGPQ